MSGMCRHTGRRLDGWDHIRQSLEVIFTTRLETRVERRRFGAAAKDLLDKSGMTDTVLDHYVAIAEAIDAFEPRVELRGFRLIDINENGDGQIMVDVVETATNTAREIEVPA